MAYVEIGHGNGGIVLNLGEGGLAVQAAHPLRESQVRLRFRLPDLANEIDAVGEVLWSDASAKRAGLRFVEVPPLANQALREWVSSDESTSLKGALREDPRVQVRAGVERNLDSKGTVLSAPLAEEAPKVRNQTAGLWSNASAAKAETASSQNSSLGEVKLPEIAWWVEPSIAKGTRGTRARWALSLVVATAFGAGLAGWGQPKGLWHLWQKIGWERAPVVRVPAASATEAPPNSPNPQTTPEPSTSTSTAEENHESIPVSPNSKTQDVPLADEKPGKAVDPASAVTVPDERVAGQKRGADVRKFASEPPAKPPANRPKRGNTLSTEPQQSSHQSAEALEAASPNASTVIVRAPEPGSPAIWLTLPEQTMSATAIAAVTSRRRIRIAAATTHDEALAPERVTVGRLLASSAAFELTATDSQQNAVAVEILVKISKAGEVEQATVLDGSPRLSEVVLHEVRQWKYEPSFVNGQPIESEDDLHVIFRTP